MNTGPTTRLIGELIALIEQLVDKQTALQTVISAKLEAMRRCDPEGMFAASRREGDLTAEVSVLERRRQEVVSRLCPALGLPVEKSAGAMTLRTLIPELDPQAGKRLVRAADRLRGEMLKLAEANRVVDIVCRQMMAHFKSLFAAMVQPETDASTYSSVGEVGLPAGARVLDAVG